MLYGPQNIFGQQLTPSQRVAQRNHREAEARIAKAAQALAVSAKESDKPTVQSEGSQFFAACWNLLGSAAGAPDDRAVPRWTVQAILAAVCDHYQVPLVEVISASRTREVTVPRQLAMYLSRKLTRRSLPEIGRRFGERRHTTVLHAVRKITGELTHDPQLARDVAAITKKLTDQSASPP